MLGSTEPRKAEFDELWRDITKRGVMTVQDYGELKHVFNLIYGCESYLEVGTAEGNSLYILTQALKPWAKIFYIDLGEKHTEAPRNEILNKLRALGLSIREILGDSNSVDTWNQIKDESFEVVFIDAGHSYENVKTDAKFYGPLATKYVIFHDVTMPDVSKAFEEYAEGKKHYRFVLTNNFGFGVVEV